MIAESPDLTYWQKEWHACAQRIAGEWNAKLLWQRFTAEERVRLGDDFYTAYRGHNGTAGMWMFVKNVSRGRAIVDVAALLRHIMPQDVPCLLHEIGEDDMEVVMDRAIVAGHLVLRENPRAAYWKGKTIDIEWDTNRVLWDYLLVLCRHSKGGKPIDTLTFGDKVSRDHLAKRKSRLLHFKAFPKDLGAQIKSIGVGQQKLLLPPEQIRIFEVGIHDELEEWKPERRSTV